MSGDALIQGSEILLTDAGERTTVQGDAGLVRKCFQLQIRDVAPQNPE